ncbi:hypothetical protein [Caulobacter sp. S45]|uniref:hypothetical protein n=1 Tax=Caulobacter sp. S45 TaxID=1641861 RepID=UPI0015774857|nr:hypothetical protein [Caulobacter sp. S45]
MAGADLVIIPDPPTQLTLEHVFELQRDHRRRPLWLMHGEAVRALGDDPDALVAALLRLANEALLIHQLAEQEPHRPVAELLNQVVHQLKGS